MPSPPRATVATLARAVFADYMRAPGLLAAVVAAMTYQVGFNLFLPIMTRRIFDQVLPERDGHQLAVIAAWIGGALAVRVVVAVVQERAMASLAARAMAARRTRMFAALQGKPPAFYAQSQGADVLSRFSSDLAVVEGATSRLVPRALYAVLNITGCTAMMAVLDARLAAVIAVALAIAFAGPRWLGARAAAATARRRDAEKDVLATVQESVALHAVVRSFGLQAWVRRVHDAALGRFRHEAGGATFAGSLVEAFTVLTFASVQVLALCAGGWLAITGHLTAGQLVAFTALIATVSGSTFGLSSMMPLLIEAAGGLARVDDLRRGADHQPPDAGDALPPLADALRFDAVTFSYTGERNEVDGVSLAIPAGAAVAFVGPSGSGKSTAVSLITRHNVPASGRVTLDGVDLSRASPASLYAQMAIVAQESLLFDTSIRENIRTGRLEATDAEVEAAAKRAEIHDVIAAMPRGYETIVGERGGRLSGGQRQRVAIARAILRDPKLLVLDEATSALDPATEEAITRTLAELGRGRTIVSVTHRLSTVVDYDTIFVMDDGKLAESGSHGELLALGGLYRKLWDKQTGVSVDAGGVASVTPALLGSVSVFESLDDATRAELATRFITLDCGEDHELFRAGDPGDAFYIVARGRVDLALRTRTGRSVTLVEGDSFGEIAMLEPRPRTATARTRTPCTLLVLSRHHFAELIARQPAVAQELRKKAAFHLASESFC
jgi:ATP-binding cassette subfamily B protein|nr:ATP-binding cassette domain-containing protein [Kofleriaceae bacterium]